MQRFRGPPGALRTVIHLGVKGDVHKALPASKSQSLRVQAFLGSIMQMGLRGRADTRSHSITRLSSPASLGVWASYTAGKRAGSSDLKDFYSYFILFIYF